jgi:GR25 family glycosyltransferase involved in LPS biosynthesis
VHLINLDRSQDRLAEFRRINGHLTKIVRFPAVDGRALDIAEVVRSGLATEDILGERAYKPGAVGLALSHAALWDLAIGSDEAVTLCEDDAIFNRHFEPCAEAIIETLPDDWDIVVWGWNFDLFMSFEMLPGVSHSLVQFDQDRMRGATELFQNQLPSSRAFRLSWCFGTPGYTVSASGAQKLKDRLVPFRPMTLHCPGIERAYPFSAYFDVLGVDGALNSVYRELNAFACFPPLVVTKNEATASTIQTE